MSRTTRSLLLLFLVLWRASLPCCAAEGPDEKATAIRAALSPFVEREELAGAVGLVANKSEILATVSVGFADREAKREMPTNAMFWIASQSKPITAAATMIAVEEGKINLDDPVEKYLPEFKGQMVIKERDADHMLLVKPTQPITVRQVLSHTSGLPFKSKIEEPSLDRWPLAARVRSYGMTPLDFDPGTKYAYSNAGINTAARIIEVVTKMSFEEFLAQRLFQPLGMNDTTFWPTEEQAARIATSYKPGANNMGLEPTTIGQLYYPLTDRRERFPMPAGGLFSTAHDVARFYQMLLNGGELDGKRVLSEAAVQELTKRQTPAEMKDSYGLGFSVSTNTFGHGGAFSTNSFADRQQGMIFVWLVQHAGFPGEGQKAQDAFRKTAADQFGKK